MQLIYLCLLGFLCFSHGSVIPKKKVIPPVAKSALKMNPPKSVPAGDQCACTDKNIWLDIFFAIDASFAMTSAGFDGATSFIESTLFKMTIGQSIGQQSRVGFITYGANAQLHHPLTQWASNDEMLENMELPFNGSYGTNIEAAIKLAHNHFGQPAHRPNVQKVLVIVASAYERNRYNDPTVAANTFKEDGGIIVTIEYVQEHGEPVPMLELLASLGPYQFTNRDKTLHTQELRKAFCRANCFCPTNYMPLKTHDNAPIGGCYRTVPISAIQPLAAKNCRRNHAAILAKVESREKALFLSSLLPQGTRFWTGLKRTKGTFKWPDGTTLLSSDYQAWAKGYPQTNGDCVYIQSSGKNLEWFNGDCTDDWDYICQSTPCNADKYCPTRD